MPPSFASTPLCQQGLLLLFNLLRLPKQLLVPPDLHLMLELRHRRLRLAGARTKPPRLYCLVVNNV
ncbi:hypothetical protein SBV1_410109 [Verrucomicrobia bacterium]|nr:hypothetical protein SBV1_410109 [Verrucomicrobiota bacterium]